LYRSVVLNDNDVRVLREHCVNISKLCRKAVHEKAEELLQFEERIESQKLDFDIP